MKTLFGVHPWKLVETALHREDMRLAESLTSIGNAHMGMRGNFEERYTADSHRGTYLAGVWFPDKTRVGWWKNGYPAYFGKVINAVNLMEIRVQVDGEEIDLARMTPSAYYRELDMEHGLLLRRFTLKMAKGDVAVEVERFASIARKELLAIRYRVTPSYAAEVVFLPALDTNVTNEDSNYGETFWECVAQGQTGEAAHVSARTRENPFGTPRFDVFGAMHAQGAQAYRAEPGRVEAAVTHAVQAGETAELVKLCCVDTSRNHASDRALAGHVLSVLDRARAAGYGALRAEQCGAWRNRWDEMDVRIGHDESAQQGIRFNLFQMLCAYDGADPRLNIGPKGFTGEKYGGATYWDTEMFCLPMILSVMGEKAGKNLLLYRYLHLDKAKENARKLGCEGALYPMVTFNGEECHNEWEITFEEIHRNAAIFYAIYLYHGYSGDDSYLRTYGLPVMLEICRYWVSRMSWSEKRHAYVILGVTGPNEYENNVNNNWYTNRMAKFCLEKTVEYVRTVIGTKAVTELGGSEREINRLERIAKKIYLPEDKKQGIFEQQDGFLDKEIRAAETIDEGERPICQHWSWDRILRSCFIKQADVLQGLYCLRGEYDRLTIARNFRFYEPLTVHESSLSPCVHAVLAADIGAYDEAVALYRRTARLDLDNVNNDTEDGLHVTSMAGSWMALVKGFAGLRTESGVLELNPHVPRAFRSFSFKLKLQGRVVACDVEQGTLTLALLRGAPIMVKVYGRWYALKPGGQARVTILESQEAAMVQGMIFDLDGVLVDTAKFHYLAWRRLAREWFDMDFTERDNERFKGVNRVACMKILCEMAGRTLSDEAFEEGMRLKNGWYVEMVGTMTPDDVLPGAREYVLGMRARGIKCAIGSASKNCALVLARTGIADLFDAVADGTVASRAKPDPQVFQEAARMLGLPPDVCVVFEDAQAGIDAANAAGMRCVAIGRAEDLSGYDRIYPGLYAIKDEEMI